MEKVPPARNDGRTELVSRRWLLRLAGSAGVAAIVSGCWKAVIKAATGPRPMTPSISTLTDTFNTKDTTKWTWTGAAAATSGNLVLPVAAVGANSITTPIPYNLVGSQIVARIVAPPNPGNGNQKTWLRLSNQTATNQVAIQVAGDGAANGYLRFVCRDTVNNVNHDTYVPYSSHAAYEFWDNFWSDADTNSPQAAPTGQSYLRNWGPTSVATPKIRGGRKLQDYAGTDASAEYLSVQLSNTITFVMSDFEFTTGSMDTGGNAITAFTDPGPGMPQDGRFSGVQGLICHAVACPTHMLINFNTDWPYGARYAVQHIEIVFDAASATMHVLNADGIWRTLGYSVLSSTPWTWTECYYNHSNADSRCGIIRHAATTTALAEPLFPHANASAWVRIREASGTVYWEASTDGTHWKTLRSGAPGWDVSQCYVTLSSDYSGTETSLSSATWDNINS